MKRKYLVKHWDFINAAAKFQEACDELSEKGWLLQEFHHMGQTAGITAVFYKDVEEKKQ